MRYYNFTGENVKYIHIFWEKKYSTKWLEIINLDRDIDQKKKKKSSLVLISLGRSSQVDNLLGFCSSDSYCRQGSVLGPGLEVRRVWYRFVHFIVFKTICYRFAKESTWNTKHK